MATSSQDSSWYTAKFGETSDAALARQAWRDIAEKVTSQGPLALDSSGARAILDKVTQVLGEPAHHHQAPATAPMHLSQAQILAAALRALHAVLALRADDGTGMTLQLDQNTTQTLVDSLLASAGHALIRKSNTSVASSLTDLGISSSSSSTLPRRSSQQSLTSQRSDAGETTDGASDMNSLHPSELLSSEDTQRKRLNAAYRSVRQNALSCLSIISETRPAAFFPLWPRVLGDSSGSSGITPADFKGSLVLHLLSSDPVLTVRTAACHLIESMFRQAAAKGYLSAGIVEPRVNTAFSAFTPLSVRITNSILQVRSLVARLLERGIYPAAVKVPPRGESNTISTPTQMLEALLKLARTMISATGSARLRRSHADVFQGPALKLSSHQDPGIAITAFNLLSALSPPPTQITQASSQHPRGGGSIAPVDGLLRQLGDSRLGSDLLIQAWTALADTIRNDRTLLHTHIRVITERLQVHIKAADLLLRQTCVGCVAVICGIKGQEAAALSQESVDEFVSLMAESAKDTAALVRAETLQALPTLARLQSSRSSSLQQTQAGRLLNELLRDREATVRAAALRGVGTLLIPQDEAETGKVPADVAGTTSSEAQAIAIEALKGGPSPPLEDPSLLVRLRASWVLANVSQVLSSAARAKSLDSELWRSMLAMANQAMQDDERVRTNALRAVGFLLTVPSPTWLDSNYVLAQTSMEGLFADLAVTSSPKTKWNAVNALSTALTNEVTRTWLVQRDLAYRVTRSLSSQLASKTFKVKLAAIQAMLRLRTQEELGGRESWEAALAAAKACQSSIDGQVQEATFREARLHGDKCRVGVDELVAHLENLEAVDIEDK